MKMNFTKPLLTIDGDPMLEQNSTGTLVELTLKAVVSAGLLGQYVKEQEVSADVKVRRFDLAIKLSASQSGILNVTAEDIILMKDSIAKHYPPYLPLIVGQAYKILDGELTGIKSKKVEGE